MKSDSLEFKPENFEAKWQEIWQKNAIFEPETKSTNKPFYNLMMFPYPSAEGLHVGNMYAFTGSDIYGRFKRMQGNDVFEPIGLDGFGIHSENYAMKIGEHPVELSKKTETNFYRQLHLTGNAFAWKNKLETYDRDYYRWTQWIFVRLFKAGLAYRGEGEVNWCPSCLTVLADEQVVSNVDKQVCERCGTEVSKKKLTQWYFKITEYSQRLLDALDKLDWSEKVKLAQTSWLGRSEGAEVMFQIDVEKQYSVRVFTTRVDTIFGVTFLALAVDHELVTTILNEAKGQLKQAIREFLDYSLKRKTTNVGRQKRDDKNGVFTGFYAINPVNGEKIPVYIADYVLTGYGTGAVMGVPAHDQRDWDFAKKYGIEIRQVIKGEKGNDVSREAFTDHGELVNSDIYTGMKFSEAALAIIADFEKSKKGKGTVNWHLRDWIISRQRYWGPPIPMIFCEKCAESGKSYFSGPVASFPPASARSKQKKNPDQNPNVDLRAVGNLSGSTTRKNVTDWDSAGWYPVPDEDLPVELPYIEKFKPTGSGQSPLAQDENFVNVKCPACGHDAKRETDVSDTFLDSAWYFLRYPSVNRNTQKTRKTQNTGNSQQTGKSEISENQKINLPYSSSEEAPWNSQITSKWLPVDMYIGGAEHSVLHLLYSRFITKVFFDLGLVDFEEPFTKFRAHGLLIKDGAKMSKSRGNVVNPDDYIAKFGADTLRTYLMFCGRYSEGGDFRDDGIEGMHKFLRRVWKLVTENSENSDSPENRKTQEAGKSDVSENVSVRHPESSGHSEFMMHKTIKKVTEDIENLSYNTAIAAMMEWMNYLEGRRVPGKISPGVSKTELEALLKLLAPFAPHMTEELWHRLVIMGPANLFPPVSARSGQEPVVSDQDNPDLRAASNPSRTATPRFKSIHLEPWPEFDSELATPEKAVLAIQINGKFRDKVEVERGLGETDARDLALKSANVSKYISDGDDFRVVYVPDRLINFVLDGRKK